MIKYTNIKENKEYKEMLRAFMPEEDIKAFNIELKIEDKKFFLKIDGEEYFVNTHEVFQNSERNFVKYHLYKVLSKNLHRDLKWGILLGVRPVKFVRETILKFGKEKAEKILSENYLLSDEKINLAEKIIENQKIYEKKKFSGYSIYVHIPFCPTRCSYCSFPAYVKNDAQISEYIKKLEIEIKTFKKYLDENPTCIYFGGGTPTAIGVENLKRILDSVKENYDEAIELTIEAGRPETLKKDMLKMLKAEGVNKISINPQTMNDKTLKILNRTHSSEDIKKCFYLAKEIGIENINMDLIMGLPGENHLDFKNTLSEIKKLEPELISVHSLAIKKGSKLYDDGNFSKKDTEFENVRDEFFKNTEYEPYYLYRQKNIYLNIENLGYKKRGKESIYNIFMMEDWQTVIGFGLGATTKIINSEKFNRFINYKSYNDYMGRFDELIHNKIKYMEA